ncbi:MAG: SDR family NAD(P)-dependent oxidoreductase [Elusimicrobia bacterium]|nr:SDR family NAD(P)-dependent oxidoreductase [Elusimicrobiota bacterium]
MSRPEKVLVTGGAGYIGSWVLRRLLAAGYEVTAFDSLMFNPASLLGVLGQPGFSFVKGDVRDRKAVDSALKGMDHVVHLAAIVGEAACNNDPERAKTVNIDGTKVVAQAAVDHKVKRMIAFSTCSSYGVQDTKVLAHEGTPINPVSLYAESKIAAELFLAEFLKGGGDTFYTVFRPSTVHGPSARMRFDLIVNHFVRDAFLTKKLNIFGPDMWRPLVWVGDPAQAIELALKADPKVVRNQVFNLGGNAGNHQKRQIGEILKNRFFPELELEYGGLDKDLRSYRVDFTKIETHLGFRISRTLEECVGDIIELLANGLVKDPKSPEFSNG